MTTTQAPQLRDRPDLSLLDLKGLRGFVAATGVKPDEALDLGILVADAPWTTAGIYTTNAAAAPSVHMGRAQLRDRPEVQALVINSGNANALTGARGQADAEALLAAVEARFGGPALGLSTGVIGQPLPLDKLLPGVAAAAPATGERLAEAILTTDTGIKTAAVEVTLPGASEPTRIAGMAKGSGMIHPNMATMLAVIACDAPVEPAYLDAALRRAADRSFHEITVDGETSTNDALIALARPGDAPLTADAPGAPLFEAALQRVATALATQIVEDGEGRGRVMELFVRGARSPDEARAIAQRIALSPLVKTALAGGDANWGRIVSAAGSAGVSIDLAALRLTIGGQLAFTGGLPVPDAEDALTAAFTAERVKVELDLGLGASEARMLTTDLTHGYITINADYRS